MQRPLNASPADSQGSANNRQAELEITRGRARHKIRPIEGRAFLIGTGTDCDLVLGHPDFPTGYAYILQGPQSTTIRWLGEGPELAVNGNTTLDATPLANHDVIRMGPFEFKFRVFAADERPQPGHGASAPAAEIVPTPAPKPAHAPVPAGATAQKSPVGKWSPLRLYVEAARKQLEPGSGHHAHDSTPSSTEKVAS
jgi:hypothetical protein